MSITLQNLTKTYNDHLVVNHVSLDVPDGEFFVLLGSSGSGKTTVLKMIAGLTSLDEGRILLHGRDVTALPVQERQVGFVFQHYALFQHMTVADNIEFGLRIRKVAAAQRRRRREELLELVGLTGLGGRMPSQISGGQQQRVALARALAHQPEVLLLDEPLGALDAKIRLELRRTLRSIQRELGITTILVTHDQEEAFELADRVGVMSFGRLLEVGPPQQLYRCPQTEFVATFLGTANLLVGQQTAEGVRIGQVDFPLAERPVAINGNQRVQVLFRPEDVALSDSVDSLACPPLGQGEVAETIFAGSFERLRLRLPPMPGVRPISPPVKYGGDAMIIEAMRSREQAVDLPLKPGDRPWLGIRRVHQLEHPGLNFLLVSDGSPQANGAVTLGGQIARLAHARVTLLGHGSSLSAMEAYLQSTKEALGSGLTALETKTASGSLVPAIAREINGQSYDLIVLGLDPNAHMTTVEQILQMGDHHLLLAPRPSAAPARALICVADGEPAKEDVLFAGRLVRHVGAEATLLSVMGEGEAESTKNQVERFLAAGVRTLELLGVPARAAVRRGAVRETIANELISGNYDMLVMGAPLPQRDGKISLNGVISQILGIIHRPILIVRTEPGSAVR
ncbi:MAG: ATP-binding cassette domain-containing protein [Anaerolineae bacterium]|nr:ATP-binding cassette domain-containing protein [Anaerolineae bacterium]